MALEIVIPVYNEAANIEATLREIQDRITVPKKVIVVYDFDEDSTLPVVRNLLGELNYPVALQKNIYGRGALNAIKTGLKASAEEAVLVIMADLADDLGIVDEMYRRLLSGDDVVCGSRYMKGGRQIGGPLLKRTMSRLAGVSLYFVKGVPTHDVTNSFKMYSRRLVDNTEIESNGGFELGMELVVKAYARGYRIGEVPTTWRDRTNGESRFRLWAWIPHYLKWYFYALRSKPGAPGSPDLSGVAEELSSSRQP